jgi:hypothetical protein
MYPELGSDEVRYVCDAVVEGMRDLDAAYREEAQDSVGS